MALKGVFDDLAGAAGDGSWLGDRTEYFGATGLNKIRKGLWQGASGNFARTVPVGGSLSRGLIGSAVVDVIDAVDFQIDNTSSYLSGSTGVTVNIVVWVRVENASISVTPQIYNVTTASVASTTGGAACSATATDFSGTDSKQTLVLTPAAGVNLYRLRATPSAATFQFWAMGWRSLYI